MSALVFPPKEETPPAAADGGFDLTPMAMMHNLTLIRQFADEALVKYCLAAESRGNAERLEQQERIVRPSASAAAKLLGANGKPVNGRDAAKLAKSAEVSDAAACRAAFEGYDIASKVCMRNLLQHVVNLGPHLGLDITVKPTEARPAGN